MKFQTATHTIPTILLLTLSIPPSTSISPLPLALDSNGDYTGLDLIAWITSHPQGYVHPSIRIGREIPGDKSSIMGLFVKSDPDTTAIEEDELIARIPWSMLIGPGDEYDKLKFSSCQEIRNLAAELKLGEESAYAPYIRYLLAQPRGSMPGEWSPAGKQFFASLLGNGDLPPYEESWRDEYRERWINQCGGDPDDPMEERAYWLASSRDEDTLMLPIYDMANHSNDPKKLNTHSFKPERVGKPFRFEASRKIFPGEQIYNSYNRCNPCSEANFDLCETFSSTPTANMFAHFGFVEQMPQYWRFDCSTDEENEAEIVMCLGVDERGGMEVEWFEDYMPDEADREFLERHLKRLRMVRSNKDELEKKLVLGEGEVDEKKMPRLEWESIWRYYEELVRAMDAAVYAVPEDDAPDDKKDEL